MVRTTVNRRDERHVLRIMLDVPVPGKRRRVKYRKPGGETLCKRKCRKWGVKGEKCGLKGGGRIGQNKVEE